MAKVKKNDFVMTLNDDEDVGIVDDDEVENTKSKTLNTNFKFEYGDEKDLPWTFKDAMKSTRVEDPKQTSINEKIRRRLKEKEERKRLKEEKRNQKKEQMKNQKKKSAGKSKKGEDSDEDEDDDDEDESGEGYKFADEDEDEDAPDEIVETEDNEGEGSDDDEEKSDEAEEKEPEVEAEDKVEQYVRGKPKVKQTKMEENEEDEVVDDVEFSKKNPKKGVKAQTQNTTTSSQASWDKLNLTKAIMKAIHDHGYSNPTPIQEKAIPSAVEGKDLVGSAVTGSGKTGAFVIPVLQHLLIKKRRYASSRVLILLPTRELAAQCHSYIQGMAKYTTIRACLVVGGLSMTAQQTALRELPDIIVATPGRIIDHLRNSISVNLEELEVLVLDEADRLLDMGFTAEVQEIVRQCPKERQTLLFSATMTSEVSELIKLSLKDPVKVAVDRKFEVASTLTQEFCKLKSDELIDREAAVIALCRRTIKEKAIIFCAHKKDAHRLKIIFGLAGLQASELHGAMTQLQRLASLEDFRDHKVDYLICTDVAARGLDILGVETVINFHMPRTITDYTHRVGRTARAGSSGRSISFVGPSSEDRSLLKAVSKYAQNQLKKRVMPPEAVAKAKADIDEMEADIKQINVEETEEMMLRKADMEASRSVNLITHHDEIMARPPKSWFMTNKDKRHIKRETRAASMTASAEPKEKHGPQTPEDQSEEKNLRKQELARERAKKRRREQLDEIEKEQREQHSHAKAAKKLDRSSKFGPVPGGKPSKKRQKKNKEGKGRDEDDGDSIFGKEMTKSSGKASKEFLKAIETHKVYRKDQKGSNKFKSKKKFNRRR